MKCLIVYYSRTKTTKAIAEKIQKELDCDIEELDDYNKHSGAIGYMKGGFQSSTGRGCEIAPTKIDPSKYDLVIIGTPVWASNMASPIITYLYNNKSKLNNIASFCTCGSSGYNSTFKKIEKISGKTLKSKLYLTSKDMNNSNEKIKEFLNKIR